MNNSCKLLLMAICMVVCAGCSGRLEEGIKAYKRGDFAAAMNELKPLAEAGDAEAQNYVGFMYDNGEGVAVDYRKAAMWYAKAAEQGYAVAQYNLGMLYGNGLGVDKDWVQALKWFNLAVILSKSRHERAVKDGNYAVTQMTPEQVGQAEKLMDEWLAQHKAILAGK